MNEITVGVISDTHGLMRPEAIAALRGSDLIIHAGDVGHPAVIDELRGAQLPTLAGSLIDAERRGPRLPGP